MSRRVVDLSVPCSNRTAGVTIAKQTDPPVYLGYECAAWDLSIRSHTGTYFETSSHLFPDGRDTDGVAPDDLVLPGRCVRPAASSPCIDAEHLEAACGPIAAGSALLVDAGIARDKYFSREAARWMAARGVKLMGSSTPLYDRGFVNPTGFFVELFQAEIPIIANLRNLDRLPERGFTLVALPLHVVGVCTVPCRVVAIVEED